MNIDRHILSWVRASVLMTTVLNATLYVETSGSHLPLEMPLVHTGVIGDTSCSLVYLKKKTF